MLERLKRWRPEDRWACLAAYGLLLIWCLPLLLRIDFRGPPGVDWEWFLAYFQALRSSLVDHHQFPGFNPWMYLGTPLWANPQIGPLSHFTPLVLIFGPLYGMKLGIAASYYLSFETARLLGRALFKHPLAAVMAGLLYALNTGLAAHWVLGHVCFSAYPWAPLLILGCLRLGDRPWAGALAGLIAGLMVQYGVHYYMIYVLLLAGMLALHRMVARGALRPALRFGAQFVLGFLCASAFRLIPLLEVMQEFPRKLWLQYSMNAESLWHMFFVPEVGPVRVVLRIFTPDTLYQLTSTELNAYIGVGVLALALVSLRWGARFFHLGALLSLLLLLGTFQPWHLSRWLSHLRPFDSMWVVTRWRVVFLACMALAAAAAVDRLLDWAKRSGRPARERTVRALAWCLPLELLLVLLPSWSRHVTPYLDKPVTRQRMALPQTPHLLSAKYVELKSEHARLFFAPFRSNVGIVDGYDPLFGYRPVPSKRLYPGHPGYRGEFVVEGRPVTPQRWSPNRLRFVGLPAGKTLEVNLNPGRGWSQSGTPLFVGGRLFDLERPFAVTIPASGEVDLCYSPPGLRLGLLLSLLAGIGLGLWGWTERRRGPTVTAPAGPR